MLLSARPFWEMKTKDGFSTVQEYEMVIFNMCIIWWNNAYSRGALKR